MVTVKKELIDAKFLLNKKTINRLTLTIVNVNRVSILADIFL